MNKPIKSPSMHGVLTFKSTQHKMSTLNQTKLQTSKSNLPLSSPNQSDENIDPYTSKNMNNNLSQQNISTQKKKNFAETLNPNPFPKKDQAVIFDIENE